MEKELIKELKTAEENEAYLNGLFEDDADGIEFSELADESDAEFKAALGYAG